MAANFNIVPAALLELPDRNGVIKVQIPTGPDPARLQHAADVLAGVQGRLGRCGRSSPRRGRRISPASRSATSSASTPTSSTTCSTARATPARRRELHPIFYGSFDWHSCVHGYWMLARLLARFPAMAPGRRGPRPVRPAVHAGQGRRRARLPRPAARAAASSGPTAGPGCSSSRPNCGASTTRNAPAGASRWRRWPRPSPTGSWPSCPKATYPIRTGTHYNPAFALALARDYAVATRDDELLGLFWQKARRLVRPRPRLPGLGAGRRRLPLAGPDGGRMHAAPAAARAVAALVRRLPARASPSGGPRRCSTPPASATGRTARSPTSTG